MNDLQLGIDAVRHGQMKKAQRHLKRLLKANPDVADAWYWLHFTVTDPQVLERCLKRALKIDRHHRYAREALDLHQKRQQTSSAPTQQPPLSHDTLPPESMRNQQVEAPAQTQTAPHQHTQPQTMIHHHIQPPPRMQAPTVQPAFPAQVVPMRQPQPKAAVNPCMYMLMGSIIMLFVMVAAIAVFVMLDAQASSGTEAIGVEVTVTPPPPTTTVWHDGSEADLIRAFAGDDTLDVAAQSQWESARGTIQMFITSQNDEAMGSYSVNLTQQRIESYHRLEQADSELTNPLSIEDARAVGQVWLNERFAPPGGISLSPPLVTQRDDTYFLEWLLASDNVVLPSAVTIAIDRLTSTVTYFHYNDVPITINLQPSISAEQAIVVAQLAANGELSPGSGTSQMLFVRNTTPQTLVWRIEVTVENRVFFTLIDAHSGTILMSEWI